MADVELLPCPFCGSAPRFDSGHGDAVCVLCGECGASSDFSPAGREDEAAAAWNTRANLAPLQAENERLREEVSGLRAARIAYANEFPATEAGDPDTGNIHANIRALKARADDLAEALRELVDVFSESGMYDEEVFAKARAVLAANVTSKEN